MTYLDKLIGRTVDSVFCEQCFTFKPMKIGIEYNTCEACGASLVRAIIQIGEFKI